MLEGTNGAGWWELYQPRGRRGSGFIPLKILNPSIKPALASIQRTAVPQPGRCKGLLHSHFSWF